MLIRRAVDADQSKNIVAPGLAAARLAKLFRFSRSRLCTKQEPRAGEANSAIMSHRRQRTIALRSPVARNSTETCPHRRYQPRIATLVDSRQLATWNQ